MTGPPLDPLEPGGIKEFGDRLRSGKITAEAAIATCLARIEALEPRLGAFEHVAAEHALAVARALDTLLAAGTDLGPLMGVPVAVKDIIAVDGMPTTAGSNLDVTDLVGPEGSFIKTIKRCGYVIVGKTKTPEFAMGAEGLESIPSAPRLGTLGTPKREGCRVDPAAARRWRWPRAFAHSPSVPTPARRSACRLHFAACSG